MSGVRLLELDSADLLDVLHFMFEEDFFSSSEEESDAKDLLRKRLYEELYETTYDYGSSAVNNIPDDFDAPLNDFDDDIEPFDPLQKSKPTKPYTPTTKFNPDLVNPYAGVLDAPMGG